MKWSVFASLALTCPLLTASGHDEEGLVPGTPFGGVGELSFLKTGDPLVDWNPRRTWTATDGRTVRGKLLAVKDGQGAFALENGTNAAIPLDRLVEDDRRFIREWEEVSVFFNPGYEATRSVTDTIEAGIFDGAFAKEGKVHETRNFRFECDAPLQAGVVKDFSRLFEATYLAVLANPLGLALAKPAGAKYPVKLFARDSAYHSAGGSPDAAGVYLIEERVMLVPLSSLGLTEGAAGWRKTRDFDPRTLIHETTHALTHQWLALAPMWFVEGFADYMAAIPYREGKFFLARHREGIADLAAKKFGGEARRFPLFAVEELVGLGHRAFMGEAEAAERPIELPRVEPFRIALVAKGAEPVSGEPSVPASQETAPVTSARPPAGMPRPADGATVVRRYVSSMVLLDRTFESGQVAPLRRYLFDFARFEWDRNRYLTRYEVTYKAHHGAVEAQIRDFNAQIQRYNAAVAAYNAELDRHRRRETEAAPVLPEEPVAPEPVPVPEILADPRQPESLSRRDFLEMAWERHLGWRGALAFE